MEIPRFVNENQSQGFSKVVLAILFVTTFLNTSAQSEEDCSCQNGNDTIFHYHDGNGMGMIVCGYDESQKDAKFLKARAISIFDCEAGQVVFSNLYDEISVYTILTQKHQLVLQTHHFVPVGDDWKMTSIPMVEQDIKYDIRPLRLSEPRFVFDYPTISEVQKDSIRSICGVLLKRASIKKVAYPLDYETLYILFVGAVKNVGDSRSQFENLRKHYLFDGAVAETLGEIQYNFIINNL